MTTTLAIGDPQTYRPGKSSVAAWKLCSSWIILLPLLYLTVRGTFSFDTESGNNGLSAGYGYLMAGTSGLNGTRHLSEIVLFYAIICLAVLPFHRSVLRCFQENKLIVFLIALAFVSTVWSQVPTRTVAFSTLALLNTAFAFYLMKKYDHEGQLQLFTLLGAVAIVMSVVLVIAYPAAGIDHKEGLGHPWQGIWGHKDHCAVFMTYLVLPGFFIKTKGLFQKLLRNLYVLSGLFLIAMTQARTGWILATFALFFVLCLRLLRRFSSKERMLLGILLIASVALVALLGITYSAEIAIALGKDPTFTGRTTIWHAVMWPILDRPVLGYGYDAFWIGLKGKAALVGMSIGSVTLGNAENGILELWLQMGAIGVAALLASLYYACRWAIFCYRRSSSGCVDFYICIVFLAMAALVDGSKYMYPHDLQWTLYVMAYAGLHAEVKKLRRADASAIEASL